MWRWFRPSARDADCERTPALANCGASALSTLIKDHLAGGASRLAALLLPQILPVFSVVAALPSGRRAPRSGPRSAWTGHSNARGVEDHLIGPPEAFEEAARDVQPRRITRRRARALHEIDNRTLPINRIEETLFSESIGTNRSVSV
jgi:hypothetical protein